MLLALARGSNKRLQKIAMTQAYDTICERDLQTCFNLASSFKKRLWALIASNGGHIEGTPHMGRSNSSTTLDPEWLEEGAAEA